MRKFVLIAAVLPVLCFAGKYTPQMYEKAIVPDTVVKTIYVHDTLVVRDTVFVHDTVSVMQKPAAESVAASVPVPETDVAKVYTDENGNALSQQYHIVIGSYQDKLNAQNLLDQVNKNGEGSPSIAVAPDGKFRVLYFSTDDEAVARKILSQIIGEYPSAWLLNLNK